MTPGERLAHWNGLSTEAAAEELLPCNASRAWANGLTGRRPLIEVNDLFAAADAIWWTLTQADWQGAFNSHPRIGERHATAASPLSLRWSAGEQSGAEAKDSLRAALLQGNTRYEERFGRVFIVCATGKSTAEMLAILERRLGNDAGTELHEAAEQQRRITQLRLRKWLGMPPARCEDV